MNEVTIKFETEGGIRASETVADLRNAAETLYFPMKLVGFWDYQLNIHLCPQEERAQPCPHMLPADDPARVDYVASVQRDKKASLAVRFPHANVVLYLR